MRSTVRLGMAVGLMGCFWPAVGQPAPDPATYEFFFRQVAQLKNVSGPVLLNGQTGSLTQLRPKDAIGLTDHESQLLNAVASDCDARIRSLDKAARPLIFEARLRLIESESPAPELTKQLKDLDNERTQTVLTHVQELRAAFGESRFKLLEAFVRSRKQAASFFPPVPARN